MTLINLKMPVVIVGPPAVGKTTIGRALARRLRIPCFDLDEMIEESYTVSIEKLFRENKESYFRLLESQCLEAFVKRSKPTSYVLSTGGGTVISEKNRFLLKRCGKWIYLKASPTTILQRGWGHPLFHGKEEQIKILLNQRANYYNEADSVVDVDQKPTNKVIEEVIEICHSILG